MQMTTYAEAVRTLQPIIPSIFNALEAGLEATTDQHSRALFARRDDPHYYLHTVRRVAIERLRELGLQATSERNRLFVPMSGLLLNHAGLSIRVMHSDAGPHTQPQIPIPGRSRRKQAFWRQQSFDGVQAENLLLLWRDDAGVLVDPMTLVRTLGGDHRRPSLKVHWQGQLSRDMVAVRAADLDELVPDYASVELGEAEEAG